MKLKSILLTSLFATVAAFSIGAQAASDMAMDAMDKATETKAPAPTAQAAKATPMKRHSHSEEKTGVPQKMPETTADKPNAATDMTKHYHPRDAK